MRNHIKFAFYLLVSVCVSTANAGAYEDFFKAVTFDDARSVDSLLARGFDPNSPDEKGQTGLYLSLREGSFKVAAVLLKQPQTRVDQANSAAETALMMAALKGHTDWVAQLLDHGARIDGNGAAGGKSWTALHYACAGPQAATVQLLLKRGAALNALSPNGTTPVMMAARYGSEDAVDALLKAGADLQLRNDLGLSAADFARQAGRDSLAGRLQAAAR